MGRDGGSGLWVGEEGRGGGGGVYGVQEDVEPQTGYKSSRAYGTPRGGSMAPEIAWRFAERQGPIEVT